MADGKTGVKYSYDTYSDNPDAVYLASITTADGQGYMIQFTYTGAGEPRPSARSRSRIRMGRRCMQT